MKLCLGEESFRHLVTVRQTFTVEISLPVLRRQLWIQRWCHRDDIKSKRSHHWLLWKSSLKGFQPTCAMRLWWVTALQWAREDRELWQFKKNSKTLARGHFYFYIPSLQPQETGKSSEKKVFGDNYLTYLFSDPRERTVGTPLFIIINSQLISVYLNCRLISGELEKFKLLTNYAGTVNYNFYHMCVRKVDGRARTHAAHHCGEQLLSDALVGVGVRAMDDLSTDSPLILEQSSSKHTPHGLLSSHPWALNLKMRRRQQSLIADFPGCLQKRV